MWTRINKYYMRHTDGNCIAKTAPCARPYALYPTEKSHQAIGYYETLQLAQQAHEENKSDRK